MTQPIRLEVAVLAEAEEAGRMIRTRPVPVAAQTMAALILAVVPIPVAQIQAVAVATGKNILPCIRKCGCLALSFAITYRFRIFMGAT
jgi:hypothetical protein